MKYEYQLTLGLNDKQTKKQEITTPEAKQILNKILLNGYGIYAYTLIECTGCYTHQNGTTINETSLRLEIVTDNNENKKIYSIVRALRHKFNQESIMLKKSVEDITF